MPRRLARLSSLIATVALTATAALIAACTSGGSTSAPPATSATPATSASSSIEPSASPAPTPTPEPVPLVVGLGYIPSVQFAPFYLAQQRGDYAAAGLAVTFQNQIDPDLIRLTGQGAVDLSLADGTSLIPAVSQGIPVRYVATIYADFPNVVFGKASSGVATTTDLAGRKLGIPGRFGSSWIMLQALLTSAGLTPDDLTIVEYPDFGQLAGVEQGAVDVATGFVNNEPVRLAAGGAQPVILRVDEVVPLPGNGLIVGAPTLDTKPEAVRSFVAVTLDAMADIVADPSLGLEAAIATVPELESDRANQLLVLEATIDAWQDDLTASAGLGAIAPEEWAASIEFLAGLPGDLVPNPVTADQLVDPGFLPAG